MCLSRLLPPIAASFLISAALPLFAQAPANDDFANRTIVSATPFTDTVSAAAATLEGTDPLPNCGPLTIANTVWYGFTPAADVVIIADTVGSNYDTVLSAWTGSPGSFAEVACNEDIEANVVLQSKVIFEATAGTSYSFMITPFEAGMAGTLVFNLKVFPLTPPGQPPFLYSVSSRDQALRVVDPATANTIAMRTLKLTGKTVTAGTGLATNPLTGDLFAMLKLQGQAGRQLVTLDPATGIATNIGNASAAFAGIAFDSTGTLWGVTGDGATPSETLFTISTTDATKTQKLTLGAGDEGEALGFNPDDGLLYHASGKEMVIFETINPTTLATAPITIGAPLTQAEANALTYWDSQGVFLWVRGAGSVSLGFDPDDLLRVTPAGAATSVGSLDHRSKGLAFAGTAPETHVLLGVTGCCPNQFGSINVDNGALTVLGNVGDANARFAGGAAAVDPATNRFFVAKRASPTLLTIDTTDGTTTERALAKELLLLGFETSSNTLFGVTGCCPNEFVSIDVGTGALTSLGNVGDANARFAGGAAAVDPATNRFFVAKRALPTLMIIDTTNGTTTERALAKELLLLGFETSSNTLFGVTGCCPNEFVSIDVGTGALASLGNVGDANARFAGAASALNPDANRFYVIKRSSPALVIIDTTSGTATEKTLGQEIIFLGID